MLDMPAYANRLGAMIMCLNEGVPDRASTPPDSWGRYCCYQCGHSVSPEREECDVCPVCRRNCGFKPEGPGLECIGEELRFRCRACNQPIEEGEFATAYGAYCDPNQGGCGWVGQPVDRREREE